MLVVLIKYGFIVINVDDYGEGLILLFVFYVEFMFFIVKLMFIF